VTNARKHLASQALVTALRLRRDAGISITAPLSVFDLVEDQGVGAWFCELPSLEGMYSASPKPVILLSSMRPPGRQAFTCAHEFGHHIFKHGLRVDESGTGLYSNDNDEFLADCFAGYLLMPKTTVCNAFVCRGWNFECPTATAIYTVANYLGVGYSTLIYHMMNALGIIEKTTAVSLLDAHPKEIRRQLTGQIDGNLLVVDKHWYSRPVDVQVSDRMLVCLDMEFVGSCATLEQTLPQGKIYVAKKPGIG
jgi:Zn-dependent peptidase ImmA (M78 family)